MARNFDEASTQYLTRGSVPFTGTPVTFSCWFRATDLNSVRNLVAIDTGDTTNYWFRMAVTDGGAVRCQKRTPPQLTRTVDSSATTTAGVWAHGCARLLNNLMAASLNGSHMEQSEAVAWTNDIDTFNVGRVFVAAGADQHWHGDIAHVALWDQYLTNAEVEALAAGASPRLVRPASLREYLPLTGGIQNLRGLPVTNNGTTAAGSSAPVWGPESFRIGHAASSVVVPPTIPAGRTYPKVRSLKNARVELVSNENTFAELHSLENAHIDLYGGPG